MNPIIEALILCAGAAYMLFLPLSITAHTTGATFIYKFIPIVLCLALGFLAADLMGIVVVTQ